MSNSFSNGVQASASKSRSILTGIYRRSVELLGEEMAKTKPQGGQVPFLTGNLARSLLASTDGMPSTSASPLPGRSVGAVTATLTLGQSIWLGYQAQYARRQNYGFIGTDALGRAYNQAGSYFVESAIERWPELVRQAAEELGAKR